MTPPADPSPPTPPAATPPDARPEDARGARDAHDARDARDAHGARNARGRSVSRVDRAARIGSFLLLTGVAAVAVLAFSWRFTEAPPVARHATTSSLARIVGDLAARARPAPSAAPAASAEPAPAVTPADATLRREGHVYVSGGVLHAPRSFHSDDGTFDLVLHFHGNTQLVEESYGAAEVNALVYVVNLGIGSGAYESRYARQGILDETLARVRDAAEKRGLKDAKLRRVALSSWSAGYGAIAKLLDSAKNRERIDALLMLDGLHVSYAKAPGPDGHPGPDPLRLDPFLRFAEEAALGHKLFTITHSFVEPRAYASVEETANALLAAVGAHRLGRYGEPPHVALPSLANVWAKDAERWLEQTNEAHRGGFHVRGYMGNSPEHHMAHLIQMSVIALPDLVAHWKT
ncbi:hypothetical protein [Chondromyces apiculatus]|uniref:hypothetical protein n=1 Tax=Chondromyces apiculatus TaxID=51 RepID=UPI0012DC73C2|nr:hypothetical protein [Chondromyces apiculatus]